MTDRVCGCYGTPVFWVRGLWRHGWVTKTCITSPKYLPSSECCWWGDRDPLTNPPGDLKIVFQHNWMSIWYPHEVIRETE